MRRGYFTFVLHSHIPYVRQAGMWPFGEETLHEAIAETYIPLLNGLYDLKAEGYQPKLTIGLTPILLEQLADKDVMAHFERYVQEKLALVEQELLLHEARPQDAPLLSLAAFYRRWYEIILLSLSDRYHRDLAGAFARLQSEGVLDIVTSAATHGYLPLMERDSTIYGQLVTGITTSHQRLGRRPRGIWLPECGYRPAYFKEDGPRYLKPGAEDFLGYLNLGHFFTETNVVTGGQMVGKVAGDVVGPYGGLPVRKLVKVETPEPTEKTTFRPYYVTSTRAAVFGRDEATGLQVWSAKRGYPGDYLYREFHRKDDHTGLQYWRITGADVELGNKDYYNPETALDRARDHANQFVWLVTSRLAEYERSHAKPGIIVSAYDTELFGHWWFEGVAWLKEVLRQLSRSREVGLTTAGEYLEAYPPDEVLNLQESSWGAGGGHYTWLNPETEWMWPLIHAAERRMEKLVALHPTAEGEMLGLLNQAARELLLLESSDWPFLVSTGQAKEYATGRFQQHLARFNRLAAVAERGIIEEPDGRFLAAVAEADNPFPAIDYRVFAEREGKPLE